MPPHKHPGSRDRLLTQRLLQPAVARDLLVGRAPFETPAMSTSIRISIQERKEAEAWVRVTFNLPPETDLTGPGTLAQDPRFVRGTELWELGMYDEARLEFEIAYENR